MRGVRWPLYMRACDEAELERALAGELAPRAELLAPLDAMLWDRRLIEALFDFEYRWEIYTPADKRRYGYYTLPLLYGEELTGRIELARGRTGGALELKGAWYESGREPGVEARVALEGCLERFARFNDCAGRCGCARGLIIHRQIVLGACASSVRTGGVGMPNVAAEIIGR